jgi:hypothetical protein
MFEGLLSPWHLLIIGLAVFVVVGPKALADRWKNLSQSVGQWVDDPDGSMTPAAAEEPAPPVEPKTTLARRIGRRWYRRRHRRGR